MIIISNNVCKQCYADVDVFVLVAALYHSLQEHCLGEAKTPHGVTLHLSVRTLGILCFNIICADVDLYRYQECAIFNWVTF